MTDKNHDQLRGELELLYQRVQIQRQVFRQVRTVIWAMRGSEDLERLLKAIWEALSTLGMSFKLCGVNIIDESADAPNITVHNMTASGELQSYNYELAAGGVTVSVCCGSRGSSVHADASTRRTSRSVGSSNVRSAVDGVNRPCTGAAILLWIRSLVTKIEIPVFSLNAASA